MKEGHLFRKVERRVKFTGNEGLRTIRNRIYRIQTVKKTDFHPESL